MTNRGTSRVNIAISESHKTASANRAPRGARRTGECLGLAAGALMLLVAGCSGSDPAAGGPEAADTGARTGTIASPATAEATGDAAAISTAAASNSGSAVTPKAEVGVQFSRSYEDFSNPERGVAGWVDVARAWEEGLNREMSQGYRLFRTHIQLESYRYSALPNDFIERLERGFAMLRRNGAKAVPRFVYNAPDSSFAGNYKIEDASIDRVLAHIEQLGPVLERNRDVIAWFEAGFAGAWGEWHSSLNGLDTDANEIRVRDALLASFPKDRKIAFRNPADVKRWYPEAPPANGRIGFHNDCILSGKDDASTWIGGDDANLKGYVRQSTLSAPYGGETCQLTPLITDCDSIRSHGSQLRLSWINRYGTLNSYRETWKAQGCEAEVLRSLGYRIELTELRLSSNSLSAGQTAQVTVRLRNSGWAPLYNPRNLQLLLLSNGQAVQRVDLAGTDLREVQPTGDQPDGKEFQVQFTVPSGASAGWMEIGIAAPDQLLPDDARQAVRFANEDKSDPPQRWVADGGYFRTGLSVQVVRP